MSLQTQQLNDDNATDHSKHRKLIKDTESYPERQEVSECFSLILVHPGRVHQGLSKRLLLFTARQLSVTSNKQVRVQLLLEPLLCGEQ